MTYPAADLRARLDRLQWWTLAIGLVSLALCGIGALFARDQFFRSYLVGFLLWIGIALGSAAIGMLHHLTGGRWGLVIRNVLQSGASTVPLMAILFIPILLGIHSLYSWSHPGEELGPNKRQYLSVNGFVVRSIIYLLLWSVLALTVSIWSRRVDRDDRPDGSRGLRRLSGIGLLIYGLTVTFASVDWVMSLQPHWFSSIWGMLFIAGQGLASIAFAIIILAVLVPYAPLAGALRPQDSNDLGNLLLMFVLLWSYLSFAQYLIIWAGNLREEVVWYVSRVGESWQWLALFLVVFHFAVPLLILLNRGMKRDIRRLAQVAAALLVMRLIDLIWLVMPTFTPATLRLHWMDLLAPIGIGGVWMALFLALLKRHPLPRLALQEVSTHE